MNGRVYLSVGDQEDAPGDMMVQDLASLAGQLREHRYEGLEIVTEVHEDETHLSVIPIALSEGLRAIYADSD